MGYRPVPRKMPERPQPPPPPPPKVPWYMRGFFRAAAFELGQLLTDPPRKPPPPRVPWYLQGYVTARDLEALNAGRVPPRGPPPPPPARPSRFEPVIRPVLPCEGCGHRHRALECVYCGTEA